MIDQFEVRCHGRDTRGIRVVHITRTPALSLEDASARARRRAVACGVRLPLVFAIRRLP